MNHHLVWQALLVALEVLVDGGGPIVCIEVDEGSDTVEAFSIEGVSPNGDNNVFVIELYTIIALEPARVGGLVRLPKTWVVIIPQHQEEFHFEIQRFHESFSSSSTAKKRLFLPSF